MKQWKIKLVAVSSVLLICVTIFLCSNISSVTIEGNSVYSAEEIKQQLFTSFMDDNSITLYLKNKLLEPKKIPFIQEYIIKWESLKRIHIQVYEKSIISCVKFMGEYVYFDRDGTVLESTKELKESVPCIEGVKFKNFTINVKMELEDEKMLSRILNISESINHYKIHIDRVIFNSQNEVTIYQGDIKVRLGGKERYDEEMAALSDVLSIAENKKLKGEIDMTNFVVGDKIILKQNK